MSAFFVINDCVVIDNGNSAVRTGLFALLTADAGILTVLASIRALFLIGAEVSNYRILGDHRDDVLGTSLSARAAADTSSGVDMCDTVANADSICRANACTVAAADTSVNAGSRAAVNHTLCAAALHTVVSCLGACSLGYTVTVNESNSGSSRLCLNSEDLGESGNCVRAAGDTEIGSSPSLCNCLSVVITALKAARAAVRAGERASDRLELGIILNTEEMCEKRKQYAKNEAHARYYEESCQYSHKIHNIYNLLLSKKIVNDSAESHKCKGEEGSRDKCDRNASEGLGHLRLVNS